MYVGLPKKKHVRRLGMLELGRTDTGEIFAPAAGHLASVILSAMFFFFENIGIILLKQRSYIWSPGYNPEQKVKHTEQ